MSDMHFTAYTVWSETGLTITVHDGFIEIKDINVERSGDEVKPKAKIRNRVSRWELFRIGLWLVRRALSR